MRRMKLIPLVALVSTLTACGGDMSDLERFIDETKNKHHGKVDPIPEFPPYQTFAYSALDVRDPFRPQTDLSAPSQAQTWGLVRDPEGTIHRVQPGNYAGENHGKIVSVSETRIDIVELVADGLSGWVNRDAQLAMAED